MIAVPIAALFAAALVGVVLIWNRSGANQRRIEELEDDIRHLQRDMALVLTQGPEAARKAQEGRARRRSRL